MKQTYLFFFLISSSLLFSQFNDSAPWMQKSEITSKAGEASMEEITKAFNEYWKTRDHTVKGSGYKPFMRWENHWKNQTDGEGVLITPQEMWEAWNQKKLAKFNRNASSALALPPSNWTPIGPFTHSNTGSWSSGQGRVNVVCVDPSNPNTLYVGTPAGGIWKSTDAGLNWTPLSDNLPQIGVSGIAVDPTNSNIIYIATGDKDAGDTYFVGVMKSLDGGATWNATGAIPTGGRSSDIFIHPTNSNILWVATSTGVFKTSDAGTTWTNVLAGSIKEIEIKPGDPNTVYAVTNNTFYKSTDAGTTFTATATGLPATSGRYSIEVTAANPDYIYILSATTADAFQGVYKSTDSGVNFTKTLQTIDVFESTQAWYDMALAVSQTNANEIYTGCLNVWKSTDGGDSFTKVNSWSSPAAASYTHADIHFLRFYGNKLFCGSDGGIYASTNGGTNFTSLTAGLQIGQFYKIAVARQTTTKIMGGLQDNGGYAYSNNQWKNYYGADGMDVAIDPNNSNKYYGFIQNGSTLYLTTNAGNSRTSNVGAPAGESGNWVTPLAVNSAGEVFGGYKKLYKLNSAGTAWVAQSTTSLGALDPNTDNVELIAIDPSNDNNMFIANGKQLYKSLDRGITFNPVALLATNVTSICVHSSNSAIVYVTTSGNTSGKALKSIDSGATFTDITSGLPGIAKNVIKHQARHVDNPLYVGTSLGVYYKDDTMATWLPFETNLPNVSVKDLEINLEDSKIVAGTYGRGAWECPIPASKLCGPITTTWNGTTWDNGEPASDVAAIFNGDYNSTGSLSACSAIINGNAQVRFLSGHNFNVGDIVTVAPGANLTIENNANLIQINKVTNTGNITTKRNSAPLMRLDYTLWSSPVAGQQLQSFSPSTLATRFYTYNPATNLYVAVSDPTSTNFATGKGYLIRMPNNHPVTPTIWNGTFMGNPNNGTVNLPITSNTFNAIGNPYPSTIDADAFIADNSITGALYFWRKSNNAANTSYATYTLAGGVGTANSGDPLGLIPNGIIQVGQGFIAKSTATNLSFTNLMRVTDNGNQFLKTSTADKSRIWLNLTNTDGLFSQTMVAYMPNATQEVDETIDGLFFNDSQTALTSIINDEEFAVQGRALPFDTSDVVPLGFKSELAGNYTIAIDHFDGLFASDQDIFLRDNLNNVTHNLKTGNYSFATTAGIFNSRFDIIYQNLLGVNLPTFNENSAVLYKNKGAIHINTGAVTMANVKIFDISGRLLTEKSKVNATETTIDSSKFGTQVLIVQITSDTQMKVSKKVVN